MKFQKQDVLNSEKEESEVSSSHDVGVLFEENLKPDDLEQRDDIKQYVAEKLKKYQDTKVSKVDFRILQGVLSTSFGREELTFTEKNKKKKEEKDLKRKMSLRKVIVS